MDAMWGERRLEPTPESALWIPCGFAVEGEIDRVENASRAASG